jgi:4-amino-4-deoxy-L-arabinose transferase-like glycosyltransferase
MRLVTLEIDLLENADIHYSTRSQGFPRVVRRASQEGDARHRGWSGREDGTMVQEEVPSIGAGEHRVAPTTRWRWGGIEPFGIVLLSLALNLAGNARTGLWDRDEPRFAVCVREMRARGDWIFPTFNGEPRYHKPILIYWLMGLGTAVGGDNPFGVRLVSAVAGAGTVLGTWWLGRRMFGPRGGRLAALILATAPIAIAESKLATTDATLSLWLFGCQGCLWVLGRRPSHMAAALFWIMLSLATLTKGPVGPALIAASSLFAWWWGWPAVAWKRLHWRRGLVGFAILTAPWFLTISLVSAGEFLRVAVGRQIVDRLASDVEAHGGFPGYYPVVSALVFYPWSALLPAALVGAWMRRKTDPNLGFLLGWTVGPLLLLECFRTKLIHYYLPAFPACALLAAWLVLSVTADGVNIRRTALGRLAIAILVAIGLVGIVLLVAGTTLVPGGLRLPMLLVAVVMAAGTLAGASAFEQAATERAVYSLAVTWAVVMIIATGWLIPNGEPYRTSRVVGEKMAALSARLNVAPVLLEYQEPGVVYTLGHPIATTRDRDGFFAHLKGGRSVLTVALPSEIDVMRSHFGLVVTPLDQVDGYVLTKGQQKTLQIAVVHEGDELTVPPALGPNARRIGLKLEQALVK